MRINGYDSHLFLFSLLVLISLQNALARVDHHHLLRKYIQMVFNGWVPRKASCKECEDLESITFVCKCCQNKCWKNWNQSPANPRQERPWSPFVSGSVSGP